MLGYILGIGGRVQRPYCKRKKILLNEHVLVEGDLGSLTCGQEMEQVVSMGRGIRCDFIILV